MTEQMHLRAVDDGRMIAVKGDGPKRVFILLTGSAVAMEDGKVRLASTLPSAPPY